MKKKKKNIIGTCCIIPCHADQDQADFKQLIQALLSLRSSQAVNFQLSGNRIRNGLLGLAQPTQLSIMLFVSKETHRLRYVVTYKPHSTCWFWFHHRVKLNGIIVAILKLQSFSHMPPSERQKQLLTCFGLDCANWAIFHLGVSMQTRFISLSRNLEALSSVIKLQEKSRS